MSSSQSLTLPNSDINSELRILPLYNTLAHQLTQKIREGKFSITSDYKNRLTIALNSLSRDHAEQITVLIIHYFYLTNVQGNPFIRDEFTTKGSFKLPYEMRVSTTGKGLSFNIDAFPSSFQALLGIYCGI